MKIRSIAIILALTLAVCLLAGCGGSDQKGSAQEARIGVLTALNLTSEEFADLLREHTFAVQLTAGKGGAAMEYSDAFRESLDGADIVVVYYDTLTSMQMGLQAGDIEVLSVTKAVADYLCDRNDSLACAVPVVRDGDRQIALSISYSLMTTEENAFLCGEINQALDAMNKDDTLNRLRSDRIYGVTPDEEPEATEFTAFPGAETIRVAVTGDLPPMDYIAADGTPAGFNTAMLAELGRRLGRNIELVSVDAGARATALAGGVADVVFWARTMTAEGSDSEMGDGMDVPPGTILTDPYFTDMVAIVAIQ